MLSQDEIVFLIACTIGLLLPLANKIRADIKKSEASRRCTCNELITYNGRTNRIIDPADTCQIHSLKQKNKT